MSYSSLNDPVIEDGRAFAAGNVCAKFCSMGFVTSSKWFSCYIKILDGILHLYADEKSSQEDPQNVVLKISLSKYHRASAIKRKNYSTDPAKIAEFYCFYLEVDNGMFSPTKELKIGCVNRPTAETLIKAIDVNTRKFDASIV
mmetsp:Transcript_9171/g.12666  ORF Transcript_9171/g.12666 Transcript_9171/m.12666 type:complete len:143 (+) Transcript_9171:36-464(+)